MENTKKLERSFLLYGNENYLPIIKKTIKSIRSFSDLPIFVYLLNYFEEIDEKNVHVKKLICDIRKSEKLYENYEDGSFYIDRNQVEIYDTLIQRPFITKDVLENYSETVCYLDADTTCLPNIEQIFDLYPKNEVVPFFTKGVYDFMYWDGVGNSGDDLTKTLEHPTCELYDIDQSFRFQAGYRQTGYYIAGQNSLPFISEWMEMCNNPIIKNDTVKYAAYHEETIANCLLWKYKSDRGLPHVYVNGTLETIDLINDETTFIGEPRHIKDWLVVPSKREELFFIHGEKRLNVIEKMINKLNNMKEKLRLLFITPHLSTGGMPQFVLKRIQELQKHKDEIELFLVEYSQFSHEYVVQRNQIIELLGEGHFWSLGYPAEAGLKPQLIEIIKNNNIDLIHFEEISEAFEGFNRVPLELLNQIFSNDRTWKIVESCHNVWFTPTSRKFHPDAYSFVTPHHLDTFESENVLKELHIYPYEDKVKPILEKHQIFTDEHKVPMIEKIYMREQLDLDPFKTHVMNVGLWTSGKNQKEGVEIARNVWEKNKDIMFHFIGNQAPNFEEYWGPIMNDLPPNVKVWGERNDVDKFMVACDVLMFNSTWECNPLVVREAINYGMKIIARDLPQYKGMFDGYITKIESDEIEYTSDVLLTLINSKETYKIEQKEDFGDNLFNFYNLVHATIQKSDNKNNKNNYKFFNHFVINPYLEINGESDNDFNVRFYDQDELVYQNNVKINSWIKLNKQYHTDWKIEVRENDELIFETTNDYKDKRVYISFGSSSLGDTLAWIPYCEEFRKKHGCKVIVSTFMNYLFKDQYPEIEFVEPGVTVNNLISQYRLGWFYDDQSNYDFNKHPQDFKKLPLQQTATDILGLEFEEIRPKLNLPKVEKKKKVGIGFHSTAQAKYWNNSVGWQKVIDYLNGMGYECMIYSKEGDGYMNNFYPKGVTTFKGGSIQEVIDDLVTCEFFIGLGSGLSWLAWACELPIVLISGFSDKINETVLDTYRVINEDVCFGCFKKVRLDAGDWNWCPFHKGTDREFECTKQISSDMVIDKINEVIKVTDDDLITIVLAHANTEEKRNLLIESLKSTKTKVLLSTNHPINDEIESLCDFVNYETENPILLREEFDKYNSYFYFVVNEDGVDTTKYFDYDHGYAAYKLISGGLKLAKSKGFKNVHIINYDYIIDDVTLNKNKNFLNSHDAVFYVYKEKPYPQDSYSTGYFSGRIDRLDEVFSYYKSKGEYYSYDDYYKILEIITCDVTKKLNLNVKELYYEDLLQTSSVNKVNDEHMFNNTIQNEYDRQCNIPSDINEHIPTLYKYSTECEHITEMGVRYVSSTWAFLNSTPKKLISYDIVKDPNIDRVIELSKINNLNYEFIESDVLKVDIEPTELLFIDTLHTYNQLYRELQLHSDKVSKYIILHDTVSFGYVDEQLYDHASDLVKNLEKNKEGLLYAIDDFLKTDKGCKWMVWESHLNNNGLTVLKRKNTKEPVDFDWGTQTDWYINSIKNEIFGQRIYERFFEVEPGDVVVDVGASLGPFTYSILNKKPKHVFCFEPCEEEFPTLIKNTLGHPVSHLLKGISSVNGLVDENKLFNSVMGTQNKMETITFKRFLELYDLPKIDFLKTDCEGGEYDIFTDENFDYIKNNVKKIAGEWHLNEYYYPGVKEKFREFRDKYLSQFDKYEVYSVDNVDIKWDLWNEHFIEYYTEVIIYIDNR